MGSVTEPGQAVEDDHALVLEDLVVQEAPAMGEDGRAEVGSADHRNAALAEVGSTRRKATRPSMYPWSGGGASRSWARTCSVSSTR